MERWGRGRVKINLWAAGNPSACNPRCAEAADDPICVASVVSTSERPAQMTSQEGGERVSGRGEGWGEDKWEGRRGEKEV